MKYLVFGLGNIGPEYHETRHNIGFMIADAMAEKYEVPFKSGRYASLAELKFRGRKIILIKPSTYMNLSGNAIRYWMNKEKVNVENILVILDDVALPIGKLRLRKKGSDGGHNGLTDIIERLGTNVFPRLRVGIDDNFHPSQRVDYVLGKWSDEEMKILKETISNSVKLIEDFVIKGIDRTMNFYN